MAQVNVQDVNIITIANVVLGYIQWVFSFIIDFGLMIILVAAILQQYGVKASWLPHMGANEMFWLMAAYACYRFKGKLV